MVYPWEHNSHVGSCLSFNLGQAFQKHLAHYSGLGLISIMSKTLCFQICDMFSIHLFSYWFEIMVWGDYDIMVHGI
jgi:hypothetical protein